MRNSYLQPVSKSLGKRTTKVIYADELKSLIERVMKEDYSDKKSYKLIYHLKNKWFLVSLKKTIFYIKKPEEKLSDALLVEDWYWPILHKHCTRSEWKDWYIWWIKALELSLGNIDIPDAVEIVCDKKQSIEVVLADKHTHFKKYSNNKRSLFKPFKKRTYKWKYWRYSFCVAKKELALLETFYNFDKNYDRYAYEFVKKFIKKNIDREPTIWEKVLQLWKHHTSINRLYNLAKEVNKPLAEELLTIIKKRSFVLDT